MKLFLALVALCTTVLISQQSQAADPNKCLCYSSIGMDAGHTGKQCDADGNGGPCECTALILGCSGAYTTTGACTGVWQYNGTTATGLNCCVKGCRAGETSEQQVEQKVEATTNEDLGSIYGGGTRSAVWFGYDDGVNRSPAAGRSQAQTARLDACMGHTTVTNYAISQLGWNSCYSDCDSATNGHCDDAGTQNGSYMSAFRCKDRCDCHIGNYNGSTCENL